MSFLPRLIRLATPQYLRTVRNLTSNTSPTISQPFLNKALINQLANVDRNNHWIWQQNDKIKSPLITKIEIDLPNGLKYVPTLQDPVLSNKTDLELPTIGDNTPLEAARLIVIRRRKMKRHKLKKLRKRMKYEWAKRRQRREWNKEKAFQAELIQQCKTAETFSAEQYVAERLAKLNRLTLEASKSKKDDRFESF